MQCRPPQKGTTSSPAQCPNRSNHPQPEVPKDHDRTARHCEDRPAASDAGLGLWEAWWYGVREGKWPEGR